MVRAFGHAIVCLLAAACGSSDGDAGATGGGGGGGASDNASSSSGDIGFGGGSSTGSGGAGAMLPELWYAVDQLLVLVSLDGNTGAVAEIQSSAIIPTLDSGQTAITMLDDGSLVVARLGKVDYQSRFYHIASPPRDGSDVDPVDLGPMPGGIMIEGLYTDCDGRLYGMDSGVDDSSAEGNRLLRFLGDVTAGDFTFEVVSDLATADVADIDDMSPGIDSNQITDNPGLAIDTGNIHAFDYETGSGNQVAQAGTFGIHALGGPLFGDGQSRLYVLNDAAELFEIDAGDYSSSAVLGTGPTPAQGDPGWSALAGPLTDCETGFTPPR